MNALVSRLRTAVGANGLHLLLHAAALAIFFCATVGFLFQDSPKFDLVPGYIENTAGAFELIALVGIPLLAAGSLVLMVRGRVAFARRLCWASLAVSVLTLLSVAAIYRALPS